MGLSTTRFQPNMTKDIMTSVLNQNFAMLENLNISFNYIKQGTATTVPYAVTSAAGDWVNSLGGGPLIIPHKLGYIPIVMAYVRVPAVEQYILLPSTFQSISGPSGAMFRRVAVNVDKDNIYILDTTITNGVVATTLTDALEIKYYLLRESAQ